MDILIKELFTTSIGLLSLFTIGFIIAMGAFISNYVKKQIKNEELQK